MRSPCKRLRRMSASDGIADDRGFTLIEMALSMTIFSILFLGSVTMVLSNLTSSQVTGWRATTAPTLRIGLDAALAEVRSAIPPATCARPIGAVVLSSCQRVDQNLDGAAVYSASATGMCVYSSRQAPADPTALRQPLWGVCLDGTTQQLLVRHFQPIGTITNTTYSASPIAGDPTPLIDLGANGSFAFAYRDSANTVINPASLSTAAQFATVASVVVTSRSQFTDRTGVHNESVSVTVAMHGREYGGS